MYLYICTLTVYLYIYSKYTPLSIDFIKLINADMNIHWTFILALLNNKKVFTYRMTYENSFLFHYLYTLEIVLLLSYILILLIISFLISFLSVTNKNLKISHIKQKEQSRPHMGQFSLVHINILKRLQMQHKDTVPIFSTLR